MTHTEKKKILTKAILEIMKEEDPFQYQDLINCFDGSEEQTIRHLSKRSGYQEIIETIEYWAEQ